LQLQSHQRPIIDNTLSRYLDISLAKLHALDANIISDRMRINKLENRPISNNDVTYSELHKLNLNVKLLAVRFLLLSFKVYME